jgi:hypothetical protein
MTCTIAVLVDIKRAGADLIDELTPETASMPPRRHKLTEANHYSRSSGAYTFNECKYLNEPH